MFLLTRTDSFINYARILLFIEHLRWTKWKTFPYEPKNPFFFVQPNRCTVFWHRRPVQTVGMRKQMQQNDEKQSKCRKGRQEKRFCVQFWCVCCRFFLPVTMKVNYDSLPFCKLPFKLFQSKWEKNLYGKKFHTVCSGDEIVVKLPAILAVVALFCNCWWINWPGDVEFGLMLRVELCAGEFPVPAKDERKKKPSIQFQLVAECEIISGHKSMLIFCSNQN